MLSRYFRRTLIEAAILVLLPAGGAAQSAPEARQVLVLQSTDRGSVVFDSITADFRAELQQRTSTQITMFDFVVPIGFSEAPETPVIDFLHSVYADRQPPDVIVTIGGPAAAFTRRNRQQLFPRVPAVFAAVDTRFLADAPFGDSETSVAVTIDYTRLIDDILRLLPATRNVFVVTGPGPLGTFWHSTLQRDFERYRDRLTFIWSSEQTYEEMLEHAARLPPSSAIVFLSAGTYGSGSWQGAERNIGELSALGRAPVFGVQSAWLGAGIVGGRLLDNRRVGAATADVVARILNGEPPASIKFPPLDMSAFMFDARQLRRWNIPESRLPGGSEVRFRPPSLWRDYRGEMLAVLAALLIQAILIVGLLYQRRARQQAELESRRNLSLAADVSRRMTMSALTGSIAHELSQPLNSILHNVQAGQMMLTSNRASPEMLQDILTDIRTADVRASEIIERHRTMLRSRHIETNPIDVHAVVRESVGLVAHDTKERLIHVDVHVPPTPCLVVGDQVLLQQVVVNLMMNAMDAMADTPAGSRRIAVRSDVGADDTVTVSVRDAGPGLPDALNGNLFEPFVTTKTNGMGIGLTIVRTIVEAHRGRVEARNHADGGAVVSVTLPRKPEARA